MSNLTTEERLKRLEKAVYLMTWYVDRNNITSSKLPDILQELNCIILSIEADILGDKKDENSN